MKKLSSHHQITLLVAHNHLNQVMRAMDLKPEYKWYYERRDVRFSTATPVDHEYFMNIIEKSKAGQAPENIDGFWIPAIVHQGELHVDPGVKILSDGKQEMFVETREPKVDEADSKNVSVQETDEHRMIRRGKKPVAKRARRKAQAAR